MRKSKALHTPLLNARVTAMRLCNSVCVRAREVLESRATAFVGAEALGNAAGSIKLGLAAC